MHKKLLLGLATLALSIANTQAARAATFNLSFSGNNFTDFFLPPTTAPVSAVSGTFIYDAPTITSPITSLNSVNLTIAGYSYSSSEIGFRSFLGTQGQIGGTINGIGGVTDGTNDFLLEIDYLNQTLARFLYTTAGSSSVYKSPILTSFLSITPVNATAVPEPLTIIGSLVGGAAALRLKRKLAAANKG